MLRDTLIYIYIYIYIYIVTWLCQPRNPHLSFRLGLRTCRLDLAYVEAYGMAANRSHRSKETYVVKQKDDGTYVGGVSSCSCRCGGSSSPILRFELIYKIELCRRRIENRERIE